MDPASAGVDYEIKLLELATVERVVKLPNMPAPEGVRVK
jgi:hypothetical protein